MKLNNSCHHLLKDFGSVYGSNQVRPLMLVCETVNICNNNCIICPYYSMTRVKKIMSMEVFKKVINDYIDIGGGYLSLSPVVGDIFIDNELIERLDFIESKHDITSLSVTTNAILANKYSDADLKYIVTRFNKIIISIYGIDREEYSLMTKSNNYDKMLSGVNKILQQIDQSVEVQFAFRFLKQREPNEIKIWILGQFNKDIKFTYMHEYANWGVLDVTTTLPFAANWKKVTCNDEQCIIPIFALQVLSNGNVSYCPCDDYDGTQEFFLGNVLNSPLSEILNSKKALELYKFVGNMPKYCSKCSFHIPKSRICEYEAAIKNPLDLIGG